MIKIKLFTHAGAFINDAEIPTFEEAPDVIIWGERFFVAPDVDRDVLVGMDGADLAYVEAFSYAIP